MVRIILVACLALTCGNALAEGITQYQKDAIREYHTKMILGSGQDLTRRQPDVVHFQNMMKKPNQVDEHHTVDADPIPWAQVFKNANMSFGDTLTLAAKASGYDSVFDPAIDTSKIVKLNTQANSLTDIAEYLSRVTNYNINLYPESRVVIVTRKES
jgi:hypothetical protein